MRSNKIIIDVLFIVLTAVILTGLDYLELLEKNIGYALIPILATYFLGQQVERRYSNFKTCNSINNPYLLKNDL
ncbi:hypothetical protein [Marinifilum fragile]|uniref:hypothetical protein n=1 Tax=Marinifilum fragile TaxID=570161 RepID=UPI0006D000DD|nr:hypothetical protein [Marinifilum fragile]